MVIINKKLTPKMPFPGWALLKGGQTYWAHLGKSCANGVLWSARDMYRKPWWRMTGRIWPWKEARFGVDYFSAFATSYGLDSDGERIKEKVSLQEVERELWFQLEYSMQRKNWSTPQHHIRCIKSRPGYLGILQDSELVREIMYGPI